MAVKRTEPAAATGTGRPTVAPTEGPDTGGEAILICLDCKQSLSFLLVIERLERARCTTARETGVSKVDARGCASRVLQSLNYCGRVQSMICQNLLDLARPRVFAVMVSIRPFRGLLKRHF